jgi:molecular chaperone HscB
MLDLSRNYFELFGLPQTYQLDTSALSERYRELQRVIHPDRFASASDRERRLSMQGAIRVNEAFETLKDPIRRARYLLSLHGVEPDAGRQTAQDTGFLMEQMELREELEAARRSTEPLLALGRIIDQVNARIRTLVARLASELVTKVQFLSRLRQEAEALEADLEETL